jgi:hypothetical protein
MKRAFVLVTALIIIAGAVPVYASGRVWSDVKDNVAYIYHDDAWWNCCPDTVFEIVPNQDSSWIIDIYERDLDTHPCNCMCYFNFTHTLRGLAPGTYLARVWEVYGDSDPELAGTTTFSILAKIGFFATGTYMSDCHQEPEGVKVSDDDRGFELENVSSSPAQNPVEIRYHLPAAQNVNLEIYDVTGTRVRTLEVGQQGTGDHIAVWDISDASGRPVPRGIYFVRLEARGEARTLPLIVLR